MNEYASKFGWAVLGFVAGIVAIPIIVVFIPFFFAWFLYNESDEDYCK